MSDAIRMEFTPNEAEALLTILAPTPSYPESESLYEKIQAYVIASKRPRRHVCRHCGKPIHKASFFDHGGLTMSHEVWMHTIVEGGDADCHLTAEPA